MEAEREGMGILPFLARLVLLVEHVHECRQVACCNCATESEERRGDGRVCVPRLTMLGRVYARVVDGVAPPLGCYGERVGAARVELVGSCRDRAQRESFGVFPDDEAAKRRRAVVGEHEVFADARVGEYAAFRGDERVRFAHFVHVFEDDARRVLNDATHEGFHRLASGDGVLCECFAFFAELFDEAVECRARVVDRAVSQCGCCAAERVTVVEDVPHEHHALPVGVVDERPCVGIAVSGRESVGDGVHDGAPERLRVPLLDCVVDRVHARLVVALFRIVEPLGRLLVFFVCGVRLVVVAAVVCVALAFDGERCLRPRVVRFARLLVCVVNGEKGVVN